MIFWSCHFLCHQFTQRDEPDQIIVDMDALTTLSAAFVRNPDVNHLDQFMGRIRRLTVSTVNVLLCRLSVLGKQGKLLQVFKLPSCVRKDVQYLASRVQIRTRANFSTGSLGVHPKHRNRTLCELRVFAKRFYDHRS